MKYKHVRASEVQIGDLSPRPSAPGDFITIYKVNKIKTRVWVTWVSEGFIWTDDFDPDDILSILPHRLSSFK